MGEGCPETWLEGCRERSVCNVSGHRSHDVPTFFMPRSFEVSRHRSAFLVDVSGHRSVLCGEQRRLGKLPAVWRLPGVPGAILLPLRLLFTGVVATRGRWDS